MLLLYDVMSELARAPVVKVTVDLDEVDLVVTGDNGSRSNAVVLLKQRNLPKRCTWSQVRHKRSKLLPDVHAFWNFRWRWILAGI